MTNYPAKAVSGMESCRGLRLGMGLLCLLLLLGTAQAAPAQTSSTANATQQTSSRGDITGRVFDSEGEPLIGAGVIFPGQNKGTTTDAEGRFTLSSGGKKEVVLEISFFGMKKRTVTWTGKPLNIRLEFDNQTINELVVTGYTTVDARKNTSAITSLAMEEILVPGMTTIDQALEGRVPDLFFTQNSGEVGTTARMRIRGTSTLIGNREPLWVLDGIPLTDPVDVTTEQLNDPDYVNYIGNAISGINPQDIDRIDVLRDAAATALYGTRAANGVIVVTTKKGEVGPPSISYSTQMKVIRRPRYTDRNIRLMNSQERMLFGRDLVDLHYAFPTDMTMVGYEGAYLDYINGQIDRNTFQQRITQFETANTDWFDELSHDALTQSHTVSLSGGSEKTRYYASLGYTGEDAVVKTQYNNRYSASMSLRTDLSKNLSASFRLNGSVSKKNYLPDDLNVLNYAYNTTRALPVRDEDGSLYYYKRHAYRIGPRGADESSKYNYNILNEMENSTQSHSSNNIMAQFDLTYRLKHIFDVMATAAYQRSVSDSETWFGEKTNYVSQLKNGEEGDAPIPGTAGKCELPYGGVLKKNNSNSESLTSRIQANYHQSFGKEQSHMVSASLGYEVNMYRNGGFSDESRGYFRDRGMQFLSTMTAEDIAKFPDYAEWLAKNHRGVSSGKTNKLSGYLTVSYSFGDYFTLNANGRFDASNKFGSRSNEKLLPVWSVSGMMNVKELFFPNADWAEDVRLRASYGKTGNMVDGQTPNLLIRRGTVDTYFNEYYSTVAYLPNPNLKWEQTDQVNVGLSFSFFDRRLQFTTDWYYKKTHDAFTTVKVPAVNGVRNYIMNGGDISNTGISFRLSGYPIRTKDWTWHVSTGYSWVYNQVGDNQAEYEIADYLNGTAIVGGESIGTFYSYKYLGLSPEDGAPMFDDYGDRRHLLENKTMEEIVKTVMVKTGNRDATFTGQIYSTLKWKQLSISTNFIYNIGNKIRLFDLYGSIMNGVSSENNIRKEFLERWQVPGDEKRTDYPALISPANPSYVDYRNHWSGSSTSLNQGFKQFANSTWDMYDKSDFRVVDGSYLRLNNLSLRYMLPSKHLKGTPLKQLSADFTTSNVFTIRSPKLKGQDPSQRGFTPKTVLSARPSYTLGLRVSF